MIYLFVILSPENFVHQFTYLVASKNKSKVHVSCQYSNSLKILYIKRISHCFRYCQRVRYIADIHRDLY